MTWAQIMEATPKDIIHYLVGMYRYKLYVTEHLGLIRTHIKEQIEWRLKVMNPQCYKQGSCVVCGCQTVQLQFASRACEGDCYPPMFNRSRWKKFKKRDLSYNGYYMWHYDTLHAQSCSTFKK